MTTRGAGGGRSPGRRTPSAPASWRDRIDDPTEPLFTLAVVADLLGVDTQAVRRLEAAVGLTSERPSGNQRRYSRRDVEQLARATELNRSGTPGGAIAQIMLLEQQLSDLRAEPERGEPGPGSASATVSR